jgi:hypothetical protein
MFFIGDSLHQRIEFDLIELAMACATVSMIRNSNHQDFLCLSPNGLRDWSMAGDRPCRLTSPGHHVDHAVTDRYDKNGHSYHSDTLGRRPVAPNQ